MKFGLAVVILSLALALAACAQQRATDRQNPSRAGTSGEEVAIDTEVMAYLSMARAAHHEANVKEADDLAGAVAALERLTRASRPHPGKVVPEIDEVLADTYARLAELYAREGDLVKAEAAVDQGLRHAESPTYFRGHLLEVGGIVEEARAAAFRDAGKAEASSAARARAVDLLHRAVEVQEKVVLQSLDAGGAK